MRFNYKPFLVISSCLVMLGGWLPVTLAAERGAQLRKMPHTLTITKQRSAVLGVYRGRGIPRKSSRDRIPPPKSLSVAEKTKALKKLELPDTGPGTVYWQLSPRQPKAPGRGSLVFLHPDLYDPDYEPTGVARFPKPNRHTQGGGSFEPAMAIWLKSEAAGRRYLIDCRVKEQGSTASPFTVTGPNKFMQTFNAPGQNWSGVVSFVVETQDANWYGFNLFLAHYWRFYGCDATRMG